MSSRLYPQLAFMKSNRSPGQAFSIYTFSAKHPITQRTYFCDKRSMRPVDQDISPLFSKFPPFGDGNPITHGVRDFTFENEK
jgi:hypothetical protein